MRSIFVLLAMTAAAGCGSSSDAGPGAGDDAGTQDSRATAHTYARDDLACTTSADCCAVQDGCRAQALIVAKADLATVQDLLAHASQDLCVACIAPAVQVDCVSGKCTGALLQPIDGGSPNDTTQFMADHCGAMPLPAGWQVKTASVPASSAPGPKPQLVLGCGT